MADSKTILFYDGHCGLCQNIVQIFYVIDSKKVLHFAPLQGETAKLYIEESIRNSLETLVVTHKESNYLKSNAILLLFSLMPYPWKLISLFKIFPSFFLDIFYHFISKNRYGIFGKSEKCFLINDDRFLS